MAMPFDLERLEATGGSLPVIEGLMQAAYALHPTRSTKRLSFNGVARASGQLVKQVVPGTYQYLRPTSLTPGKTNP